MPIQPTDMISIGLPAAHWDFIMWALNNVSAPNVQSTPVIQALGGQMKTHLAQAEAVDKAAAAAAKPEGVSDADPAADAPTTPPKPSRRRKAK